MQLEISFGTIIKIIAVLLFVWFAYLARDILALLFISIIIVAAIDPVVDWLQKKKIPRTAGALSVYLILFIILGLAFSLLITPISRQFIDFSRDIPQYYDQWENSFNPIHDFFKSNNINVSTQELFDNVGKWLSNIPQNIFGATVGVFSGIISTIAVLSVAFYMVVFEDATNKLATLAVPKKYQGRAIMVAQKIKKQLGKWMQGQILLMIMIFILDFIGLSLIGIPYALVLAFIAGLLEIVPYVGPVISAIPGVILGFLVSPLTGLLTLLVYVIAQQAENNLIVPLIMKRAVGLNPAVVILALLIGAKLGGILGAVIAVPAAAALGIIISDLLYKDGEEANS